MNKFNLNFKFLKKIFPYLIKFSNKNFSEFFHPGSPYVKEVTDKIYPKIPNNKKIINSQEIKNSFNTLNSLIQNNNYEEAFTFSNIILNDILFIDEIKILMQFYGTLGDIQFQRREIESAIEKYKISYEYFQELVKNKDFNHNLINFIKGILINLSIAYEKIRDYKSVQEVVDILIDDKNKLFELEKSDLSTYFNALVTKAKMKFKNKEHYQAIEIHQKIIKKIEKIQKNSNNNYENKEFLPILFQAHYELVNIKMEELNHLFQNDEFKNDSGIKNSDFSDDDVKSSLEIIKLNLINCINIYDIIFDYFQDLKIKIDIKMKLAKLYNITNNFEESNTILLDLENLIMNNNYNKEEMNFDLENEKKTLLELYNMITKNFNKILEREKNENKECQYTPFSQEKNSKFLNLQFHILNYSIKEIDLLQDLNFNLEENKPKIKLLNSKLEEVLKIYIGLDNNSREEIIKNPTEINPKISEILLSYVRVDIFPSHNTNSLQNINSSSNYQVDINNKFLNMYKRKINRIVQPFLMVYNSSKTSEEKIKFISGLIYLLTKMIHVLDNYILEKDEILEELSKMLQKDLHKIIEDIKYK